MLSHTGVHSFECVVCSKKFIDSTALTSHLCIHTGECPFECEVCSKKFRWSTNLTRHLQIHTEKRHVNANVVARSLDFQFT